MKIVFDTVAKYYTEARPSVTSNEKAFEKACETFERVHNLAVPFNFDAFRMRLRNKKTGGERTNNPPAENKVINV